MTYTLACRETGQDCPYVAKGETVEETMADGGQHGKQVHGYTDEQLNDPKMIASLKALVKQQ
jgi:predicted small metal-binding protein